MKYIKKSKYIGILVFLCAFSNISYYAQAQGNNDNLFGDSSDYDKLSKLEEEIRDLRGKIEILEHNIQTINKTIRSTESSHNENLQKNDSDISPNINFEKKNIGRADIVKADINFEAEYNILLNYIKTHDYSKAEEKCKFILSRLPDANPISIDVHSIHGEILFRRKDYNQAALEYLKSYKIDPHCQKAPENLYKLALSLGNLGKIGKTCNILKKLDNYPSKSEIISHRSKELFMQYNCIK